MLSVNGCHFTDYEREFTNNDNEIEFNESFEAFVLETDTEDICMWEPLYLLFLVWSILFMGESKSVIANWNHIRNGELYKITTELFN